ncbi:hypothetical protein KBB17_00745 [Candidatus Saccharibacteria bacterium]|nr:hypothetical protein [Candidatus Saccharibacteria bacterium]
MSVIFNWCKEHSATITATIMFKCTNVAIFTDIFNLLRNITIDIKLIEASKTTNIGT